MAGAKRGFSPAVLFFTRWFAYGGLGAAFGKPAACVHQIAVGMVGGGLPLLSLSALFVLLGELAAAQREATMPDAPGPPSVED